MKPGKPPRKPSRPPARVSRPPDSAARPTQPRHIPDASRPEITLRRGPVGRETLAAIVEELANDAATARPKLDTIGYEERPKHRSSSRPPQGSSPELISIGEAPIGRATQAAIEDALVAETLATTAMADVARAQTSPLAAPGPADVFEISTFVVEGEEIFTKVSEQSRRDFVEQRLMHRLPALSMKEVVRIDVSRGAAPNTVILRVWSNVAPPKT